MTEQPTCLSKGPDCSGPVEWHTYGGRMKAFPRCQKHHYDRCDQQDKIDRNYPDSPIAPSWFDPAYAGETWDSDY